MSGQPKSLPLRMELGMDPAAETAQFVNVLVAFATDADHRRSVGVRKLHDKGSGQVGGNL